MPINRRDVVVGAVVETNSGQWRKVTKVDLIENKVWYDSKSPDKGPDWAPGHAKSSPPTIDSFCNACAKVIS